MYSKHANSFAKCSSTRLNPSVPSNESQNSNERTNDDVTNDRTKLTLGRVDADGAGLGGNTSHEGSGGEKELHLGCIGIDPRGLLGKVCELGTQGKRSA